MSLQKRTWLPLALGLTLLVGGPRVLVGHQAAPDSQEKQKKEMKMGGMMPMPEGRAMAMSKYGYDETVSRLKQAITDQNLMVVFTADHQAMLKMVGKETKGMLTIEFFHPRYGKVIVETNHAAGIEVPLRLVVMEGEMGTMVSYNKPSFVFGKYKGLETLGTELDGVLAKIVESVTK